jgi:ArsR family transcriptional regulator
MDLPQTDDRLAEDELDEMLANARNAASFLKALSHEGRLLMLCHLASGERSVSELEKLMSWRQAAVSQQLARLRMEGLVEYRRDGKIIYYRIGDEKVKRTLELVYDMFCKNA